MNTKTEALRQHPFLEGLDPILIEKMSEIAVPADFTAGEFLLRAGETADKFYLLLTGEAAVEVCSAEHSPVTIQVLKGGEVVGWSWLVPPHEWEFDVQAKKDISAIALDAQKLRELFKEDYQLGYEIIYRFTTVVAGRLHSTRLQYLELYRMHYSIGQNN